MTHLPVRLAALTAAIAAVSAQAGPHGDAGPPAGASPSAAAAPSDPRAALAASFPSVGRLNNACGVLIGPDWVLTAAHVANAADAAANTFAIGGRTYAGAAVAVAHGGGGTLFSGDDLALVRLATPVADLAPARYSASREEVGREGTFVGGAGRAGRNMIDITADRLNGPATPPEMKFSDRILVTDFDNPDPASADAKRPYNVGSYEPLELEFNVGGLDSGSGLFIDFGAGPVLAGVTSFTANGDGTQDSDYGDFSGFVRTSSWAEWIESKTGIPPAPEPPPVRRRRFGPSR